MRLREDRSGWEEAALDLRSVTPGQRYTTLVVAMLAVVVLTTGLPDGKIDASSGVGSIPNLSASERSSASVAAAIAPTEELPGTERALEVGSPVALEATPTPSGPTFEDPPPASFDPPPDDRDRDRDGEPSGTTTTTTPPPTQPPSPLPIPLPPAPAPPLASGG